MHLCIVLFASDRDWSTVDPLWPDEAAYRYVEGRVMGAVDYYGKSGNDLLGIPKPQPLPWPFTGNPKPIRPPGVGPVRPPGSVQCNEAWRKYLSEIGRKCRLLGYYCQTFEANFRAYRKRCDEKFHPKPIVIPINPPICPPPLPNTDCERTAALYRRFANNNQRKVSTQYVSSCMQCCDEVMNRANHGRMQGLFNLGNIAVGTELLEQCVYGCSNGELPFLEPNLGYIIRPVAQPK